MYTRYPRRMALGAVAMAAFLASGSIFAAPGVPTFMPALYADGEVWGTKGTTELPPPNARNEQSFDALYVITNSNNSDVQLPVGEAAPGNPYFNGGRWDTQTVKWTAAGFSAHGIVPILMSADDVLLHYDLGHLTITPGSPGGPGAPPDYFQCPLLPVLD